MKRIIAIIVLTLLLSASAFLNIGLLIVNGSHVDENKKLQAQVDKLAFKEEALLNKPYVEEETYIDLLMDRIKTEGMLISAIHLILNDFSKTLDLETTPNNFIKLEDEKIAELEKIKENIKHRQYVIVGESKDIEDIYNDWQSQVYNYYLGIVEAVLKHD